MSTFSVSVPSNLKEKMNEFDEINWSAVARKAFEEKIRQVEFMTALANKSKLTEKDAAEISTKINKSISKKFREA